MIFLDNAIDIPILIVIVTFVISFLYCITKYVVTYFKLNVILRFLSNYKKNDLNFRLKEIDSWMCANPYIAPIWKEFKNTLVFSESVALKEGEDLQYQDISSTVQNVQTTVDPLYFFNEETLITSRFNYKMIQTIPTILTGCGPLFTFLKIAIAFGLIDFSTQEKTIESVSGFMSSMQAAALVSVVAVASSLLYLLVERVLYAVLCKSVLTKIQIKVVDIFACVSSEKFLYELLREAKIQTHNSENLMNSIPVQFKGAFNESVASNLVPYLENLIFGLNQLNSELKKAAKSQSAADDVDNLF